MFSWTPSDTVEPYHPLSAQPLLAWNRKILVAAKLEAGTPAHAGGGCEVAGAGDEGFFVAVEMKALDLFCGAGGVAKGLQQAGFHVTGIDIKPQPRYCGDAFLQGDALEASLTWECGEFCEGSTCQNCGGQGWGNYDLVWASPPCQRYTRAQNAAKNAHNHPDLIAPVRDKLAKWNGLWIIENVVGAPLINPVQVCGLALGLKVRRHRLFESNFLLRGSGCGDHKQNYYVIFGHECRSRVGIASDLKGTRCGRRNKIEVGHDAMGIHWMSRSELSEAIPPAYSLFLGLQAMALLTARLKSSTPLPPSR